MGNFDTSGSVYFLGNILTALQITMCIKQETTRDKASRETEYGVHFMLQHHHQDQNNIWIFSDILDHIQYHYNKIGRRMRLCTILLWSLVQMSMAAVASLVQMCLPLHTNQISQTAGAFFAIKYSLLWTAFNLKQLHFQMERTEVR